MTREEADVVLYLVDQLRARGATGVDVAGTKAFFPPPAPAADDNRPLPKPPRTLDEKLFAPLGIGKEQA